MSGVGSFALNTADAETAATRTTKANLTKLIPVASDQAAKEHPATLS